MRKKPSSLNLDAKIYIAGHRGMVGSAIQRALKAQGASHLIGKSHKALDLRNQSATEAFFAKERPEYVFLTAAKVGGILSNTQHRADFLYDNLAITTNVVHAAYKYGVKKLLFLGSSCIYPKHTQQPIREEHLLTSTLEPTNEPYAIAKITGIKLCESYRDQHECNFIAAVPTNLYGIHDNYDPQSAHVLPALLSKTHEAKKSNAEAVEIWGTGTPKREFMHVDDTAAACILLMEQYDAVPYQQPSFINVGVGEDISISALAQLIKSIVGYRGDLRFDPTKPDGARRKLLDISRLRQLGFRPKYSLKAGIEQTYKDYLAQTTSQSAPKEPPSQKHKPSSSTKTAPIQKKQ